MLCRIEYFFFLGRIGWSTGHHGFELSNPASYISKLNSKDSTDQRAPWVSQAISLDSDETFTPSTLPMPTWGDQPVYGPRNATACLSWVGSSDGTAVTSWRVKDSPDRIKTLNFFPYPFLKVNNVDQGRNHLLALWGKLDDSIDIIRANQTADMEHEKTRALTLAEVIQQLMHMFYADTNSVLAESMSRWEARQEGREYESPGLAESHWDPTVRAAAIQKATVARNKQTITPKPLDDQKAAFVKHSLESGAMSPEELAKMFGVSIEVIKATVDA